MRVGRQTALAFAPVADGLLIDQRFRLGRVVRESGVAIVYEAKHRNGAEAWIKVPRGREHAAALLYEARVANALGTGAVNVRDDGQTDDGLPYLVLEPVTGQRLDHWRASSGGRAPANEVMGLGDELCQAIGTMHGAGFSVGLLRTDAILVLPRGGMCLLELEHARAATAASVKEDVARVGRVLYEVLSGTPCLAHSPPLHVAAPELPRAMTSTVDDASRGRFETIEELRASLRSSMPEELGPPRRPMPSITQEAPGSGSVSDLDAFVLPRASKPLFDPRDLVDSSRDVASVGTDGAPRRPTLGDRGGAARRAASERSELPARPPEHRGGGRAIAVVVASAVLAAAIAVVVFVLNRDRDEPREPATPVATFAVADEPAGPPSELLSPSANAMVSTGGLDEVIEVDEVDATPSDDAAVDVAVGNTVAGSDETTFRFEGDLSPRLVIVDGIVVGVTTKELQTRCGRHSVKIGGKGVARSLDLPCDGEQRILIERNGSWQAP